MAMLLPPKPEEPLDSECCGTGCTPCVFDIYKEKLKRWEEDCLRIRNGGKLDDEGQHIESIITPYDYGKYVVTEIIEDCLNCKILTFQRYVETDNEGNGPSNWSALTEKQFPVKLGQHVVIRIGEKCRQYTVLDVGKGGTFRIVFKIYENGLLTPDISKLEPGAMVDMRGPFGNEFNYVNNSYNLLLMFAAGTGIAPFCRIIQTVLENERDETKLVLYYTCRNEDEVILLEKLKEWSRSWNFQVKYYLPSAKDEKKAKSVHFRMPVNFQRIDKSVIEELYNTYKTKENVLYMICGTKSFEKDLFNFLKSVGVHEDKIKTF